jgi:hypothetical protein
MLRLALALGLLLQSSPINQEGYSIAGVSSVISTDEVLGAIGSGLICTPTGRLRWGSLAKADSTAWVDAGRQALADAGQSAGRYRISLRVTAIKLNLCLAWMGIGRKPRGKGTMTVDVTVRDETANTDLPNREVVVDLDLRGRDPRTDDSVLTQAIGDVVRKFIATRPGS